MVDEFEHGVFFVPLAALSDPGLVLPTIAQAFDAREAAGTPLQVQIQEYLREKQILLVLDNFEQVIDAAPRVSESPDGRAALEGIGHQPGSVAPVGRNGLSRSAPVPPWTRNGCRRWSSSRSTRRWRCSSSAPWP